MALLVVVAVARFGFTYLRRYRGGRVGLEVQYDLGNAMHDHLQTMDLDKPRPDPNRSTRRQGELRLRQRGLPGEPVRAD